MKLITTDELTIKLDKIVLSDNSIDELNELLIEYPYIKNIKVYKLILIKYLAIIANK